jgi:hypothetical protein
MPYTLGTLLEKIDSIPNRENIQTINEIDTYLVDIGRAERTRKNNLLVLIPFAVQLGRNLSLLEVKDRKIITAFLDSKIKSKEDDPDETWRTTWNSYLDRLKFFFRWLHSQRGREGDVPISDWKTPPYAQIRRKKIIHETYANEEIWDEPSDIFLIVKYMPILRNKLAITMAWDANGRPDEVCKMEWRNLHLFEQYGEGEIPANTKTGTRPVLLVTSFPYARDWKNQYPFPQHPRARLICNLYNGKAIKPDAIYSMMMSHKHRIGRLLQQGKISDPADRERLEYLVKTKKWNPYCFRHSSIDYDMALLPEFAARKKAGWSLTSRQPGRYGKRRMNQSIKMQLLARGGVIIEQETGKPKTPTNRICPRCQIINQLEIKYCTKCSYPLSPEAYEEIKENEKKTVEEIVTSKVKQLLREFDVNKLDDIAKT